MLIKNQALRLRYRICFILLAKRNLDIQEGVRKMRKKLSIFMAMAMVMGLSIFAAPTVSQAVSVSTVTVTIGATVFSLWGPGCGLGTCLPVVLSPGQSVTLA